MLKSASLVLNQTKKVNSYGNKSFISYYTRFTSYDSYGLIPDALSSVNMLKASVMTTSIIGFVN